MPNRFGRREGSSRGLAPLPSVHQHGGEEIPIESHPYVMPENRPDTFGSEHFHWTIIAHRGVSGQSFVDSIQVEVEGPTEQAALARAMDIVLRPYYRVSRVFEVCSKDKALKDD